MECHFVYVYSLSVISCCTTDMLQVSVQPDGCLSTDKGYRGCNAAKRSQVNKEHEGTHEHRSQEAALDAALRTGGHLHRETNGERPVADIQLRVGLRLKSECTEFRIGDFGGTGLVSTVDRGHINSLMGKIPRSQMVKMVQSAAR